MAINRRNLIATGGLAAISAGLGWRAAAAPAKTFEISYTEAEWRKKLTPPQFAVLRKHATERPFTSPLDKEKRAGTFLCAGCALPVYPSRTKFDSRTGWPSFWQALPKAVGTSIDNTLGMQRVEVHCRRCGGHLGHIFDDGPPPTGKRHCINGLALSFSPRTG